MGYRSESREFLPDRKTQNSGFLWKVWPWVLPFDMHCQMRILTLFLLLLPNLAFAGPKNIILFIGDGMGVASLTMAKVAARKRSLHLNMNDFKKMALVTTHSKNRAVTDSAAAATSMATGKKVKNNYISMTKKGKLLKTVLELAQEQGRATGLVVTSSITHATPASFAAHIKKRHHEFKIAEQMAVKGVNVLIGGGVDLFRDVANGGKRKDRDLIPSMEKAGYLYVDSPQGFRSVDSTKVTKLIALLAPNDPPPVQLEHIQFDFWDRMSHKLGFSKKPEGVGRVISLRERTEKALAILKRDDDGFFMMVEGSQIDWAGHVNVVNWQIDEIFDFDAAVGVALNFARADGDTLVLVTADHETGALALLENKKTGPVNKFFDHHHSAVMVPLLSFGPGSERFSGMIDNTDIGKWIAELLAD